jgi:hypothetical protein
VETEYHRFLAGLASHTPDLSGFFHNTAAYLAAAGVPESTAFPILRDLTLASETVYIEAEGVLPHALARDELGLFASLLLHLARTSVPLARVFHRGYPALRAPLETLEAPLRELAGTAGAGDPGGADRALALCLGMPGETVAFLLERFAVVARHSPGLLGGLVVSLAEKVRTVRWPVFSAWLEQGADLLSSGHVDQGVRHLELRSPESRTLLGLKHVVIDDVRDVLRIYAASLDGVSLGVSSLEASSFRIPGPYTDGRTIFLPPEISYFDEPNLNSRVYTVLAAVQASAVKMGTFGFELGSIRFNDELRNRYGTDLPEILPNVRRTWAGLASAVREPTIGRIEVVFPGGRTLLALETDLERFFYSFPTPDLARELFNLVENHRIGRFLAARYPGFREDIDNLDRYLWERRPALPAAEDRVTQLRGAIEELIRYALRGELSRRARSLGDTMPLVCRALDQAGGEAATVLDSAEICFRLYNTLFERYPVPAFCGRYQPAEVFRGVHRQLFVPEVVREVSPYLLARSRERPRFDDLEIPREESIDITLVAARDGRAEELRKAVASGRLRAYRYPEYNAHKGSYEPAHCTVFEQLLPGLDPGYYQRVLAAREAVYKRIRKKFLMMRPEDVEISRRWLSGDDVHLEDAVDFALEALRGQCPDEKVYYRKIQNRRDVAVAILLDASSSTGEELGGRGGRRVIDVEKEALSLLASALHLLDDTFGMFSYFSLGRRRVFFNIIKDFAEPWGPGAQARIPAVEAYASNRDGCAIRHVTARLMDRPERTRVLILLSDGIPADVGYGSKTGMNTTHYAIEDTRRAIAEARMAGVIPYCITVDRFARRYIPHLYGEWSYTILNDVSVLPERLSRLYLKLTR